MVKKIILYNLFVFYSLFINAQEKNSKKIVLFWLENQELRIDKNTSIRLPLINSQFFNNQLIPNYTTQWIVNSNLRVLNYSVQNVQYEIFNNSNYPDFDESFIEDKIISEFRIVNDSKQSYAFFQLVPFVKEGNSIKRIKSFELFYELSDDNLRVQKFHQLKHF